MMHIASLGVLNAAVLHSDRFALLTMCLVEQPDFFIVRTEIQILSKGVPFLVVEEKCRFNEDNGLRKLN